MRFLKIFSTLCLAAAISFSAAPLVFANSDSDIPADIQQYAEGTGLAGFKELVLEDPVGYGFQNADKVKNAILGPGFQVHLFDTEKFKNASSSLIDVSTPTGQYEYIIYTGGQAKSFLSVERYEKGIRIVLAGGNASRIGKSLDTLKKALSGNAKPVLIKDGNVRYLAAKVDNKEVNVPDVPAEKNAVLGGMDNSNVWDSAQTIKQLRQIQAIPVNPDEDGTGAYPIAPSNAGGNGINYFNISIISVLVAFCASSIYLIVMRRKKQIQ